jgi:DNA-binding CsgD family transcriptional regulator
MSREEMLREQLQEKLDRATAATGQAFVGEELLDLEDADGLLELTLDLVAEQLATIAAARDRRGELCRLVNELIGAQRELHAFRTDQRTTALANVQEGLSRLRGVTSLRDLLRKATEEVCRSCGFDRAVVFRVDGNRLLAEDAQVRDDGDRSAELLAAAREERLDLTPAQFETETLRRRIPRIVEREDDPPRPRGLLAGVFGGQSYVVAPVAPEGRVIGLIAADASLSGRTLDGLDRDTLWTFAEGLGYAVERSLLREGVRRHREEMLRLVGSTQDAVAELGNLEMELSNPDEGVTAPAARMLGATEEDSEPVLSRRELEVMRLLAAGETNGSIAERLVISENTVKKHVGQILRKLHAANRAEAVSHFLGRNGR